MSSLSADLHCWTHSLTLRVVYLGSKTPLQKTKQSFPSGYQLEIASGLQMGVCVLFSSYFSSWTPSAAELFRLCAHCLSPLVHRRPCSPVSAISSNILPAYSSSGFPEPRQHLKETPPLGLNIAKSLALFTLSGSLCICFQNV